MDEFKYYCSKCKYGTNLKHLLTQHFGTTLHKTGKRKKKPTKIKEEYKCDKCNYNSTNKNNYLTHYLYNHETKENRKTKFKHYCDACDFGVFTKSSYDKHTKTKKHEMRKTNIISYKSKTINYFL